MERILLVEDNPGEKRAVVSFLKNHGYEVLTAADSKSAIPLLEQIPDIIVTKMAGGDGLQLLQEAQQVLPETPVIITTAHGTITSAVEAMKRGAFDYLTKPLNPEELLLVIQRGAERSQLQREVHRLRQELEKRGGFFGMVGISAAMRLVFEKIQLVAPARSTVLITGESGTGKELAARAIHQLSPRKEGPFVALNCAAIPKDLAESEMFGHAKGAFTGATDRRVGRFAAADTGTLLIDEIGEMELSVQAKLLRVLESHSISPLGSNQETSVDVRVIAVTHRDLRALVDLGKFREDLYYRLHVVHIELPSLRQRREDIALLIDRFLQDSNKEHGRNVREISRAAMDALESYDWPGNVRELRNVLEGIVVLSRKEVIEMTDLPLVIQGADVKEDGFRYRLGGTLSELEREAIQQCLIETGGNRRRTAQLLGISPRTVTRKIREYSLNDPLRTSPETL